MNDVNKKLDNVTHQILNIRSRNKTLYNFLGTIGDEGMYLARVLKDYVENDGILLESLDTSMTELKQAVINLEIGKKEEKKK